MRGFASGSCHEKKHLFVVYIYIPTSCLEKRTTNKKIFFYKFLSPLPVHLYTYGVEIKKNKQNKKFLKYFFYIYKRKREEGTNPTSQAAFANISVCKLFM